MPFSHIAWWRHQMETFSALLALCAGNSLVTGEFPSQRPATRSFGVFFDLRLKKRLSKQSWGWWLGRYRAQYELTVMFLVVAVISITATLRGHRGISNHRQLDCLFKVYSGLQQRKHQRCTAPTKDQKATRYRNVVILTMLHPTVN